MFLLRKFCGFFRKNKTQENVTSQHLKESIIKQRTECLHIINEALIDKMQSNIIFF